MQGQSCAGEPKTDEKTEVDFTGTDTSAHMEDSDAKKLAHTPPKKTPAKAKRAKTGSEAPWQSFFKPVTNLGEGDCAFIAIAQALTHFAGKASKSKTEDFKPAGRLQAQLRLLAGRELEKHPAAYTIADRPDFAKKTRTAGTWAEGSSLLALAESTNSDLRIFAFDNTLKRWDFYRLHAKPNPKHSPCVIYLKLKDQRYEWLRPSEEIPEQVLHEWLLSAKGNPMTNLHPAGGKSLGDQADGLDPDALCLLGLKHDVEDESPSRGSSVRARSLLGLGRVSPSSLSQPQQSGSLHDLGEPVIRVDDNSGEDDSGPLDIAQRYKCKCGWVPDPNAKGAKEANGKSRLWEIANKHWKTCQGENAPKVSKAERQALARERFQKHVSALVDKSVASFKEFQESLQTKDPEKAQAICQVQLDNPFYRPKGGSHFLCSRCGRTAQLCVFRKLRCQKSPIDIRQQDFCRFACGDKFADYQIAWNAEKWKKIAKETSAVPKRKSAPAKRKDAVAKRAPVKCKPKSSKSR